MILGEIPRAEMPQIKSDRRSDFLEVLRASGVAVDEKTVPAQSLRPSQGELCEENIRALSQSPKKELAILVSQEGWVLDGHHRWELKRRDGASIRTFRIGLPGRQCLSRMREYGRQFEDCRPKQVRGG